MSRLHNLEVRAPRGNFVKSIVIEPRKSSLDQNYEIAEEVKCVREKYKITHIGLYWTAENCDKTKEVLLAEHIQ